jgi:superfamily I DNA and RNA helicase
VGAGDIGYSVVGGQLAEGAHVDLERSANSTPDYFPDSLHAADAFVIRSFRDSEAQDRWVAAQLAHHLTEDELQPDDLLLVLPNPRTAKSRAARLGQLLSELGLTSHLVGVSSSTDEMFVRDSIAMASIFRAKGNEAPMVYVLDSQYAVESPYGAVTRRNTLFTALTRSRAWLRVCGWGPAMASLAEEARKVREADYHLSFTIPTHADLIRMRRLHRDRTEGEVRSLEAVQRNIQTMLDLIDRGDLSAEELPDDIRERLGRLAPDVPSDAN